LKLIEYPSVRFHRHHLKMGLVRVMHLKLRRLQSGLLQLSAATLLQLTNDV